MNYTVALNPAIIITRCFPIKLKILLKLLWFLIILSTLLLLTLYIYQVNTEISTRYLIQNYEKRTEELLNESKNLEISSTKINYLDSVLASVEKLNFEKPEKIHYIRVMDNQVVVK